MAEPWFDPALFGGLYGGLVGGLGGSLIGVAGGYGGDLARKGQQRLWVHVVLTTILVMGLISLSVGVAACALGQPGIIWGTLAGIGLLLGIGAFGARRGLKRLYEQAISQQTPVVK